MATHGIDDQQAFEMLRDDSQRNGLKLVDLTEAVVHSRLLAPRDQRRTGPGVGERFALRQTGTCAGSGGD